MITSDDWPGTEWFLLRLSKFCPSLSLLDVKYSAMLCQLWTSPLDPGRQWPHSACGSPWGCHAIGAAPWSETHRALMSYLMSIARGLASCFRTTTRSPRSTGMPPRDRGVDAEPTSSSAMKTYTTSTSATGLAGTLVQVPTRRYLRGRLGGLKDMPDMPLDILIEVRVPVFCTYATA